MITLLSTVVAPRFEEGHLSVKPVPVEDLGDLLAQVGRNLCGHPATIRVLRNICPSLPESERIFWDGNTIGLAVRPKGDVRGAAQGGDVEVGLDDLEAALIRWVPATLAATPAYLKGNEWGEQEFRWSPFDGCWLGKPPLYGGDDQRPGDDLDLLRVEWGIEVYRVKYPHEK